jgi:hypothetical protein
MKGKEWPLPRAMAAERLSGLGEAWSSLSPSIHSDFAVANGSELMFSTKALITAIHISFLAIK